MTKNQAQGPILAMLRMCTSTKTKWREQGSALAGCLCKGLASATTGCTGIVACTNLQASKSNTPKAQYKTLSRGGIPCGNRHIQLWHYLQLPHVDTIQNPHCPVSICLVPQQYSKGFAPFPNYYDLALGMIPDCRQWFFANLTAHLFHTWNPETHQEGSTRGGIHNVVGGRACTSFYETAILRLHSSHSSIYCNIEGLTALAEIWCNSFHNHQKRLEIGVFNTCTKFVLTFLLYGITVILSAGLHTEEQNTTTIAALWIIKLLSFKAINSCWFMFNFSEMIIWILITCYYMCVFNNPEF